jgi:tetratricopeptide (TPR) repeat protein
LVIAWVVVKKLPDLRIVRAESNQEDKHNDLKKALIEKRIKRQLSSLTDEAIKTLKPAAKSLKDIFYSWLLKLRRKEDEYRHKLLHNDFQDEVNKERKISQLMLEVEENMNNDQLALAEAKLIDILKLDEHYQEAYFVLAKLYRQQKDYEHAIEIYNYLLKISTQPEIYRNLAAVAEERGNLKEAEENYLQAIKLDDQRAETYADLAKLYLEQEESAKL